MEENIMNTNEVTNNDIEVYEDGNIEVYEMDEDSGDGTKSIIGGLVTLGLTAAAGGVAGYAIRYKQEKKEKEQRTLEMDRALLESGAMTQELFDLHHPKTLTMKEKLANFKEKCAKKKAEKQKGKLNVDEHIIVVEDMD